LTERPGDLVPANRFDAAAELARTQPLLVPSPLPPIAATFYLAGGCWNLALALNTRTGLPIELYHHRGRPTHAYVVDDVAAIDARGYNPLRLVRAGAAASERVEPDELLAMLGGLPNGAAIVAVVQRDDFRAAAERAATVVLDAIGWAHGP
jgi:hypothetical protein